MKRVLTMTLATLLIGFACTAVLAQGTSQSLGDYARSLKKSKNAPAPTAQKVYDNDTMPTASSVSVVGNSSSSTDAANTGDAKNADAPAPAGDKKDDPQIKAGQPTDERKQAEDAWKHKLDDQNEKIGALSHELDLLQREYRVKAAEFYADTARRTQNPTGFAKDDADYKQQIADKQKALDAAKAKLSDLQEEARKAGAPTSVADQN
jgi:hypothetical protein